MAMKCVHRTFEREVSPSNRATPFVLLTLSTAQPVCVNRKEKTKFSVTRVLKEDLIGKIYYDGRNTVPVEIGIFHMQFPFVVVEEPLIDNASAPNEYDLMRMWWNAFGLDEAVKMSKIEGPVKKRRAEYTTGLFQRLKNRHDEEKAFLTEWCSLELAMLEKRTADMEEQLRNLEARMSNKTRGEMRNDICTNYKEMINQLQAEEMLNNHRGKCLHFQKMQTLTRALLDKALNVPAENRKGEETLNGEIATMLNSLVPPLNALVQTCRERQLFKTKRQNFVRKCTKLSDLGIDANIINNDRKRKSEILEISKCLKSYRTLMSTHGFEAFRFFQKEYKNCCVKLNKINEQHQTDRLQFVQHIEGKYKAMTEK